MVIFSSLSPEPDSLRLFVSNIPVTLDEYDLERFFIQFGSVHKIVVIRDQVTNEHRGFAFLNFITYDSSLYVLKNLHGKYLFEDSIDPVEIKLSDSELNTKKYCNLYVSRFSKSMNEDDLRLLFRPYGHILKLNILRDAAGTSRSSGFVVYPTRRSAQLAIRKLNHKLLFPGHNLPFLVKYASIDAKKKTPDESVIEIEHSKDNDLELNQHHRAVIKAFDQNHRQDASSVGFSQYVNKLQEILSILPVNFSTYPPFDTISDNNDFDNNLPT
ncbi:MAG: CUGBP Elav-like member 2 [Marteilia pararefringens]